MNKTACIKYTALISVAFIVPTVFIAACKSQVQKSSEVSEPVKASVEAAQAAGHAANVQHVEPPTGSPMTSQAWLRQGSLNPVDVEKVDEVVGQRIEWPKNRGLNPIGDLDILTQALAVTEVQVPYLAKARWRLQIFIDPDVVEVEEDEVPPSKGWYIDIYRFNPYKESVQGSPEVAPNLHWRLNYANIQFSPLIFAETMEHLTEKEAKAVDCFGMSCLSKSDLTKAPMLKQGVWKTVKPDRGEGAFVKVPLTVEKGERLASRVAWDADAAYLKMTAIGSWPLENEEGAENAGLGFKKPLATLLVDLDSGETGRDVGVICDFNMMDDSMRDYCVEAVVSPSGQRTYRDYTVCQRGKATSGKCP